MGEERRMKICVGGGGMEATGVGMWSVQECLLIIYSHVRFLKCIRFCMKLSQKFLNKFWRILSPLSKMVLHDCVWKLNPKQTRHSYNILLVIIEHNRQTLNLFMLLFIKTEYHFMNKIIFLFNIYSIFYLCTYCFN